ncbi:hypothetical protein INT45_004115 [Circinella minor]|uniref:Uncharacterized protein n=1 Tax=Circinella minor TaxID=1195481 RepID=A0A8H7VJ98_9FUNG|nr:hypothetical protein INT45_004115 [Circinella minor]
MNEQKKLVVEERRRTNVSISFNELFDWMQELVLEQQYIDQELHSEHTGITAVENEDTITKAFEDCELDFDVEPDVTEPESAENQ